MPDLYLCTYKLLEFPLNTLKELTLPNNNGVVDCEVSPDDYEIIKKFGYTCKKVVFIPNNKDEDEIPQFDYPFALGRKAFSGSTKQSIIIPSNSLIFLLSG